MLKPAILYKDQLDKAFASVLYSEPYFYYTGYAGCNTLPTIKDQDDYYQFAIVSDVDGETLIGYFAYHIDAATDTVNNFGLFSFEHKGVVVPRTILAELEKLIAIHHRVEWRVIDGNPVVRHYDAFCEKYGGNKVTLHAVTKDLEGNYRDEHIYEIVKDLKLDATE